MKRYRFLFVVIPLSLLLCVSLLTRAQNIPPRPNPPRLVNDFANVLSPQEEQALEAKLVAYDDSTSTQLAVVLVETLNDYPIEEYSLRILRDWGIGNKNTNNGALIVAAIGDRKIRIETGYGLEGAVPDITANMIITNDIAPAFREGRYYDGLNAATTSIIAAAAGEYQAPEGYANRGAEGRRRIPIVPIILGIILLIIFSNRSRGGGGGFMSRRGYKRGWGGPIIFPGGFGGGGGGFGGGGFGGGGFGGFGGGGGGGGGASGSW